MAISKLSVISRLDKKALWESETIFGRHFLRRLAMVFEMSL